MLIIKVVFLSIASIVVMFLLTKLMGNKQISQISMFDYINGITIGSIAAEMATSEFTDAAKPLIAMVTYGVVVTLISFAVNKSIKARRVLSGKSLIVFDNDRICKKNLSRAKLDINELLTLCRVQGFFSLDEVQTIIFESNGRLSILPKSDNKPLTPSDMGMKPEKASVLVTVVADGKVLEENLKYTGNDESWLNKQIHTLGYSSCDKILLAMVDQNNKLFAYDENNKGLKNDIFQ